MNVHLNQLIEHFFFGLMIVALAVAAVALTAAIVALLWGLFGIFALVGILILPLITVVGYLADRILS